MAAQGLRGLGLQGSKGEQREREDQQSIPRRIVNEGGICKGDAGRGMLAPGTRQGTDTERRGNWAEGPGYHGKRGRGEPPAAGRDGGRLRSVTDSSLAFLGRTGRASIGQRALHAVNDGKHTLDVNERGHGQASLGSSSRSPSPLCRRPAWNP